MSSVRLAVPYRDYERIVEVTEIAVVTNVARYNICNRAAVVRCFFNTVYSPRQVGLPRTTAGK